MDLNKRLSAFVQLGKSWSNLSEDDIKYLSVNAEAKNGWFIEQNVRSAIAGICVMLEEEKLTKWVGNYQLNPSVAKNIGLVLAGNIPMVGFHDVLCVLLSGHNAMIKLSSDDEFLMKQLLKDLVQIEPEFKERIKYAERLNEADAYIATGSNNTARYFEYYFSSKPNIIRKNRTSVALLKGDESREDLMDLGKDVFQYFGLGCRNVAKIFMPRGQKPDIIFEAFESWKWLGDENKYANNYHYNRSIYLLSKEDFFENGFFIVKESSEFVAPVSVVFIEYYDDQPSLDDRINGLKPNLQCIASHKGWYEGSLPFGTLQQPEVDDYADGVDTMKFLEGLN